MEYFELIKEHPDWFDNSNSLIKIITDKERISDWVEKQKKKLIENNLPESYADVGVVYEDPFIFILRDLVQFHSGRLSTYFRLINKAELSDSPAVALLPRYKGKYLIQHQFRHPTRSWHYEIPRGFGEAGLSGKENAAKELLEEVGGEIENIVELGILHNNTGIEGNAIQLFFADLKNIGHPNIEEGIEKIEWVSLEQLENMIKNGEITDSFTIACYTRAKLKNLL